MTRISIYFILTSFALLLNCTDAPKGEKAVVTEEQDIKSRIINGTEYSVDSNNSLIKWEGTKPTGKHIGTLSGMYGSINLDKDGKLFLGKFIVEMNTLTVTDIQDPRDKADLEDHLKSADFFNVTKFSQATFQTTEVAPIDVEGRNTHMVTGNLNMHGVTKSVSFPAMIKITDNSLFLRSTRFNIDRTLWDIKYKSGIIGTIKDKLIHDEIGLQISLVASKVIK